MLISDQFITQATKRTEAIARKWTKRTQRKKAYDIIVAVATACATMATHWVCGEFDAESCDNVETVAQRGIGG